MSVPIEFAGRLKKRQASSLSSIQAFLPVDSLDRSLSRTLDEAATKSEGRGLG